jgi:hypothetical protein
MVTRRGGREKIGDFALIDRSDTRLNFPIADVLLSLRQDQAQIFGRVNKKAMEVLTRAIFACFEFVGYTHMVGLLRSPEEHLCLVPPHRQPRLFPPIALECEMDRYLNSL